MPSSFLGISGTIWPIAWGDKEVHIFVMGIDLKVNSKAGLEFELSHIDVEVQCISHYVTEIPWIRISFFKAFQTILHCMKMIYSTCADFSPLIESLS